MLKYAKRIRHKLNKLMKSSPIYNKLQHYLIECGEADFSLAEEIILRIISVCSTYLSRHKVEHATVMQLLPRTQTRNCTVARYNNLVPHSNKFLKEQIKSIPGLHYWNIYGVKYTTVNIFQDGVHFNHIGLQRYYRNVCGAIIQSLGY